MPPKPLPWADRPEYVQIDTGPGSHAAAPATTVSVQEAALGTKLPDSLNGLSFEADVLTEGLLDPENSNIAQTLSYLGSPVLRFGGNTVDRRFFWTSTDEPLPHWSVPAEEGVAKVTPVDLERLKRLAGATSAKVIVSADLGHHEPARAADFAVHAKHILGSSLLGISIGNEPNGYVNSDDYLGIRDKSYNFQSYASEYRPMVDAILKAAPGIRIIGPDVYAQKWLTDFASLDVPNLGALAYHNYPLSACSSGDTGPAVPSVANAMSAAMAAHVLENGGAVNDIGRGAGVPVWLTETNLSSCFGGNAVTEKHLDSLWAVNYSLGAASEGTSQVDWHGALQNCEGSPPASPLCDQGRHQQPQDALAMKPLYYGMMLVNNIAPGGFQKVATFGGENVHAYAVRQSARKLSVILINENDPARFGQSAVTVKLPAKARTGTMSQLTGPDLRAEKATRIDGQESAGVPVDYRARIPGFKTGSSTLKLPITAGTATVLDFSF
ncbi:hypothetical protein IV498_07735 [Paenarthrobacter sp. Z7-10]|uniref:hypothetical protein n=1 Tax=Paenarthrobacter sp. Z7-10 TaxID=2787635 RepID=UPI0022A94FC4|nr:hypothetical protein [Paenarthrobacter sp. Z7-10]MCZ2403077.1 hypothetical protein [Paenarthrobacter sp. Z7-10]